MPISSGRVSASTLVEILGAVVSTCQTGYLKIKDGDNEGFLAVDNGTIVNARIGASVGLPALFQFISWIDARFEFHERPLPLEMPRDLAVYDPAVLLDALSEKIREQFAWRQSIPSYDSVLRYTGGGHDAHVVATPADVGLLTMADGKRTVREIAETVRLSPLEVARSLARFHGTGMLDLIMPPPASARPQGPRSAVAAVR